MSRPVEDPVVRSSRREALCVVGLWCVTLVYCVTIYATLGRPRPVEELRFVWGLPEWVFWGVCLPWIVCLGLSVVFAYGVMRDEHLGPEREDDDA